MTQTLFPGTAKPGESSSTAWRNAHLRLNFWASWVFDTPCSSVCFASVCMLSLSGTLSKSVREPCPVRAPFGSTRSLTAPPDLFFLTAVCLLSWLRATEVGREAGEVRRTDADVRQSLRQLLFIRRKCSAVMIRHEEETV
jgi:hypothetical protein